MIKALLFDDEKSNFNLLKDVLEDEDDIELKWVDTFENFVLRAKEWRPDVAILDIMHGPNNPVGIDLLKFTMENLPQTKSIMWSVDNENVLECYKIGCYAFLIKDLSLDWTRVPGIIRIVNGGEKIIPQETVGLLTTQIVEIPARDAFNKLNQIQIEILEEISKGTAIKKIQEKITRSKGSYYNHVKSLEKNVGLTLSEAVIYFKDFLK